MGGRSRGAAILLVLFLVGLSACSSDEQTTTGTKAPVGSNQSASAAAQTIPCDTSVGGLAQLHPAVDPPPPAEVPGAGGDSELDLNEHHQPPVPDDPDAVVPDLGKAPGVVENANGAQGGAQPDDLVLYRPVTTLSAGKSTDITAEPDVATDGTRALVTWNYLAGISANGGATFGYVNPASNFPLADGGFCCDQRALHVTRQGLWLWVLQYWPDTSGNNRIRLAWADDAGFDTSSFRFVDWTAQDLGFASGVMLDQPKIATSNGHVFLSINAFVESTGKFTDTVVIRVPLDGLVAGGAVTARCLKTVHPTSGGKLFGMIPAIGAADTMYLLGHVTRSELGIFRWPDSASSPTFDRVVDYDASGSAIKYPTAESYTCVRTGAGGASDWCLRPSKGGPGNDARPTTAWLANGHLGVAWNASQEGTVAAFPFVWVVVLDEAKLGSCLQGECVLGYPHIKSPTFAIQYGAISENDDGALGAAAIMGGGDRTPRCAVLVRPDGVTNAATWRFVEAGVSNADFAQPTSGDYLGITPDGAGSRSWLGTCMSYHQDGTNSAMQVHVARFGYKRDAPAG
jgi:hypothetical protein